MILTQTKQTVAIRRGPYTSTQETFAGFEGANVIAHGNRSAELETARYRALTHLMGEMAQYGVDFVEIAGNDEITLTILSLDATLPDAI